MKNEFIKVTPPGRIAQRIIAADHKYIATATKCAPIAVKKACGTVVEDVDGNKYLDFTTGVSVLNVGHCQPAVVKAIQTQCAQLMHFAGTDFYYEIQTQLAEKLVKITPGRFDKKVFFTNSGTESIEAALKLTRWSTRRMQFIAFLGGFHGRTLGSLSLTASKPVQRARYFPMMPGVLHIPYAYCFRCPYKLGIESCDTWCAKIIDELYLNYLPAAEFGAIVVEPIQGEGGYIVPPANFIKELQRIATKHQLLLIVDEIQTGFGRTGKMFCIEHFDVIPDIITVAKALGGGLPIGATIFKAALDFGEKGAHSNTFGGNLVCCAAALAAIDLIEKKKLVSKSARQGAYLHKLLVELKQKYSIIGDVRGLGLMQATEIVQAGTRKPAARVRDAILKNAYENGLLLLPCGESTIRYIPPLTVSRNEIETAIQLLELAIKKSI